MWYTISSGGEGPLDVTRDQMLTWLQSAGIDPSILPAAGRAVDAFRVATTGVTDEYVVGATVVRLVVREVSQTTEHVLRQVFRVELVDGEQVTEARVADLKFMRPRRLSSGRVPGTERLRFMVDQRLRGLDQRRVQALVDRCAAAYETHRQQLSAHAVRAVVRSYLINCGGVAVADSGGGAYLLAPEQRPQVEAMRTIVRQCGPLCRVRLIPLTDEPDLREMIVESIDADIAARARTLARDIGEWVEANPTSAPTTNRWRAWHTDSVIMQDWLMDYSQRYGTAYPHAVEALEVVVELIGDLGVKVARKAKAAR